MKRAHPRSPFAPVLPAIAAAAAFLVAPPAALAGPALICHQYQIGDARSLPWGTSKDWHSTSPDYPRQRLVQDTLELLAPAVPVVVRMETLRRATLYVHGHADLGRELLARLQARVLDAEARGRSDGLAWFDAGYFAASLQQGAHLQGFPRLAVGLDGYGWVKRAIQAHGGDPEMELAAALMKREQPARPGQHLPRARAGARPGSLLDRNLAALFQEGDRAATR